MTLQHYFYLIHIYVIVVTNFTFTCQSIALSYCFTVILLFHLLFLLDVATTTK